MADSDATLMCEARMVLASMMPPLMTGNGAVIFGVPPSL